MTIICPFCQEEIIPQIDGTCPECGCYLLKVPKLEREGFPEEDEWTETDWGEDIYGISDT